MTIPAARTQVLNADGTAERAWYLYFSQLSGDVQEYAPTIDTAGGGTVLGNSAVVGRWSRNGGTISVDVQITIGVGLVFGAGIIRVSLPIRNVYPIRQMQGCCMGDDSGTLYFGVVVIEANAQVAELRADGGGFTGTLPATWGVGDVLNASFQYQG